MKMSKLSNQTNSQDPQAVNSRVFVGNLNTFQCSKTDVERMFQRYGRLAGISMHKGYAFVQFTNPFDARNACHGEDGKTVLSQVLDVNMVAEPKPHQIGRKRQNVSKTGNDWDYYYDSYCASTLFPAALPRPMKRQRLMNNLQNRIVNNTKLNSVQQLQQNQQQAAAATMAAVSQAVHVNMMPQQHVVLHQKNFTTNSANVNGISTSGQSALASKKTFIGSGGGIITQPPTTTLAATTKNSNLSLSNFEQISSVCKNGSFKYNPPLLLEQQFLGPFKAYSNPDTLVCGNCRECFSDLGELLDHKRTYCKLRFTCKCQNTYLDTRNPLPTVKLLCAACKDAFTNPWDLMVHAQAAHMVNIYELGSKANSKDEKPSQTENGCINGVNETENITESNGDVGSPNGCVSKDQENRLDDISYNERISQSFVNVDDLKLNGSLSSRGSSPVSDHDTAQSCIVRALSIESSTSTATSNSLGIVASALGLSISSGPVMANE